MFIDIHAHAYPKFGVKQNGHVHFPTPEQLLKRHDELGIERACLLPLIGPEVYLPESNEEILEMAERSGGRFIPFCNIDPRALTNSADAPLDYLLGYYRDQGCKGVGEVMPNLPFLDPLVQNLFKHTQAVGLPLTFDISTRIGGAYGLYDDAGLPQLERSLQNFPRLVIFGHGPPFWAEIGQLEAESDRAGYPDYPIKEEGVIPAIFRRCPNLYGDLSATSGYNALARDPEYAARFLTEFQDRLLFGTDICRAEQPAPLVDFLLGLKEAGKISDDVFDKVARENAIRLLDL